MEGNLSDFESALLFSFILRYLITLKTVSLGCSYKALLDSDNMEDNMQIQNYHLYYRF